MKTSNRYRINRFWTACALVGLGIFAGWLVGRASILHTARISLSNYAGRLLEHDEEIAAEVNATLRAADAAAYPPCSEPDIQLLRKLTFSARFLKDVGRLQDGKIICTSAAGKLSTPQPLTTPDFTTPDGVSIYRDYALLGGKGDRAEITALTRSEAIVSPDIFNDFSQQPLHYSVGVVDRTRGVIHARTLGPIPVPFEVLKARDTLHFGDALYAAHCSTTYAVCAVTHISMPEVRHLYARLEFLYIATGTFSGIGCASALMMAGYKRRSQTNQLKRAILMGRLSVAYQPIVNLTTRQIVGAEALARWTDEDGDSIRPETIIALAEAEGFVSEITRFVLTRALDELGTVLDSAADFRLNINLAPSDLADPRLLLLLDEKLHQRPQIARNLNFEVTERATADKGLAVAAIRRLRARGHAVFIDDFGTGYSNLAYLSDLNVDGIKINRSFIATLGTESVTASILPQILGVAKALNLQVVVQGIEREEQANYLKAEGWGILGQGWFFGLPIPARSLMYLCAEKSE